MRFVDLDHLALPDGWEQTAASIRGELEAAVAAEDEELKSTAMSRAGRAWPSLKAALSALSYGKCWYCETSIDRADANVDHYRPKGAVVESPNHPGYWWLAIEWQNLRLACQFCNQKRRDTLHGTTGGKADHFPLASEEARAFAPQDDLLAETTMLLDPSEGEDFRLLTFGADGQPAFAPNGTSNGSIDESRVQKSIELYHLNHRGIVDQRKLLFRTLQRKFDTAVRLLSMTDKSHESKILERETLRELKQAISERAELSASARAYLRTRKADGGVASLLVERLFEW